MLLVWTNAHCAWEMRDGSSGARRQASILVRILDIPWIKLMGRYSWMSRGLSFFGSIIRIDELSLWKPLKFPWWIWSRAANRSFAITSQANLKKRPEKPSGPGARSKDISMTTFFTSSWENGASSCLACVADKEGRLNSFRFKTEFLTVVEPKTSGASQLWRLALEHRKL
jgi:hypothetical protein